jgi:hypothetical protein
MIYFNFKDSTYNAQFNLCFYISVDRFLNFPAEPRLPTHPSSPSVAPARMDSIDNQDEWTRRLFRLSSLKTQKTKLSKNLGPFRTVAPAFVSPRPIGRFETLAVAVFAEPLAFLRVRRDQREGHFSGRASFVNSFCKVSFAFLLPSLFSAARGFQQIRRAFQPGFSAFATLRFRGGAGYIFIRIFGSTLSRNFFARSASNPLFMRVPAGSDFFQPDRSPS